MITLGLASNYSFGRSLRHLFATGTKRSSEELVSALASAYDSTPDQVALFHSGRSAIAVALQTLIQQGTIAPGSPVIVPGLTCIAVIRGIKAAGLTPVFCDITPENLEYNYPKLETLLLAPNKRVVGSGVCSERSGHETRPERPGACPKGTQQTGKPATFGCILVQNTLGITWDIAKLEQLAKRHNFVLIEDLAHSAGRTYPDGRPVGTVGQATILSFGKGKAIDTITGGALIMRGAKNAKPLAKPAHKPHLSQRLRDRWYPVIAGISRATWRIGLGKIIIAIAMKLHFIERSGDTALDTNVRLTHWQAHLALKQFQKFQSSKLGPLREFTLVHDRKQCLAELYQAGYKFDEIWYDAPVAPARAAYEADFPADKCPETVKIAEQIVNLPTWYPEHKLTKARQIITKYQIKEAK